MNREIKFRAWDRDRKVMTSPFGLKDFDGDYFIPDGISLVFGKEGEFNKQNADLMQYIGLKDKNGKEIYEGDIVKQGEHDNAEVLFKEGSFATYLSKDKKDGWLEMSQNSFEFEIIGNIYENPELTNTTT